MIDTKFLFSLLIFIGLSLSSCKTEEVIPPINPVVQKDVDVYVTTANKSMLYVNIPLAFSTKPNMAIETTINLKPTETYQQIDGFGAAITGSTCYNLLK